MQMKKVPVFRINEGNIRSSEKAVRNFPTYSGGGRTGLTATNLAARRNLLFYLLSVVADGQFPTIHHDEKRGEAFLKTDNGYCFYFEKNRPNNSILKETLALVDSMLSDEAMGDICKNLSGKELGPWDTGKEKKSCPQGITDHKKSNSLCPKNEKKVMSGLDVIKVTISFKFPFRKIDDARIRKSVEERMRVNEIRDIDRYLNLLKDPKEMLELVKPLFVPETYFFRESVHFEKVAQLTERDIENEKYRIWSAGCATGMEPYSIAIMLMEKRRNLFSRFDILATDINQDFIDAAKKGVYRKEFGIRDAEEGYNQMALSKGHLFETDESGSVEQVAVSKRIKDMVRFKRHNLLENRPPESGLFDVILCRNVMIYYVKDAKREIMKMFYRNLRKGGVFITGSYDNVSGIAGEIGFGRETPSIFVKPK